MHRSLYYAIPVFLNAVFFLTAAAEPLRIGAIFSLTGFGAEIGKEDLNGLIMAKEEINSQGGIAGRPVELIVEDSRSEQKTAVSAFNKLISIDKITGLIGPNYTEFTEVIFPLADQHRVPVIAPSGYPETILNRRRQAGFYSFTLWPPHEAALERLLEKIVSAKHRCVAVLSAENSYYEALRRIALEELERQGLKIFSFTVGPDVFDLRSVLSSIKARRADAVLIFLMETGQIAAFFRQAAELGLKIQVYGENHIVDDVVLSKNMALAEGTIFFQYPVSGSDDFKRSYAARFNTAPKFTSAKSYDALFVLKQAIENCGLAAHKIQECLAVLDYQGVSGRIRFDSRGALAVSSGHTQLYTVRNGQTKRLE